MEQCEQYKGNNSYLLDIGFLHPGNPLLGGHIWISFVNGILSAREMKSQLLYECDCQLIFLEQFQNATISSHLKTCNLHPNHFE